MNKLFENWRGFLKEQDTQISGNLQLYYKLYPKAKNEKLREYYSSDSRIVKLNAQTALEQVIQGYLDNFQSFKRLIKSLPGYEKQSDENIKNIYDNSVSEIAKNLKAAPVKVFLDDIDRFTPQDLKVPQALYNTENKTIYVNPFNIKEKGKAFLKKMRFALKEEYIHLAQDILSKIKMPTHQLIWQKAKKAGLILPREQTGMGEVYDYFAKNPWEFHAKLWQLKLILKKHMSQAFDETGKIDPNALKQLINDPRGAELEILKILDPAKINQIKILFDMVAKTDVKRPTRSIA